MSLPKPGVPLALVLCIALYAANLGRDRLAAAYPEIPARIEGVFPRDGQFHGERLAQGEAIRAWGSLAGADENVGAIALGPFPAPARLRFGVTGFPTAEANQLGIELAATGERRPVRLPVDIGIRWNVVDCDVPPAWAGQPITLVARDGARTASGWLGITEPLRSGRGEGNNGLLGTLSAWSVNGFLLGLIWLSAARWLARRNWVAPPWLPLMAAAVVAALGYVAFWITFANAFAGKLFSAALLLIAFAQALRASAPPLGREAVRVVRLIVCVGAFYLTLLHLYPSSREFDSLAANRYCEDLPGDNTLPFNLASLLYAGKSPKVPGAEWQSSDRPPLQTGWLLLTWPVGRWLRFDDRTASGTSAVWFQLLWIPAAYGLLRSLRLSSGRALAWIGVMALSGFFLQNSVFTWPKLSAAAFACGAVGLWMLPATGTRRRVDYLLGAILAALGWLSHAGVAFAYLALAPWITWRAVRGEARDWLAAAAIFLLVVLPWLGYQQLYEPPANMLMKSHLAGQDAPDSRGTWAAIREAYRALPWAEIVARKQANFSVQFAGDWRSLGDFSFAGASSRREVEFFHAARALTWWILAVPLLGLVFARGGRGTFSAPWRAHARLFSWTAFTVVISCLLMFVGGAAVIHQSSYTVMLTLFTLCSAWLELGTRWSLVVVALLQTATLVSTYAVSNSLVHGPPVGLPFVLLAGTALAAVVIIESRDHPNIDPVPQP